MLKLIYVGLAIGIFAPSVPIHPQTPPVRMPPVRNAVSTDELTEAMLRDAGLFLPPNRSLIEQSQYQQSLATHTEVTIAWDVLPGAPARIRESEVKNWPNLGALTLEQSAPHIPGPLGRIIPEMPHTIWIFGITRSSEIRSVASRDDTRLEGSENGYEGGYRTKISLNFAIPDDPSITTLAVYESQFDGQNWSLRKIGNVQSHKGAN